MGAGYIGEAFGYVVMFAVLPAIIAGLFRRKLPPADTRIQITWVVVALLAASTFYSGGGNVVPILVGILALGGLTIARYSAWSRSKR